MRSGNITGGEVKQLNVQLSRTVVDESMRMENGAHENAIEMRPLVDRVVMLRHFAAQRPEGSSPPRCVALAVIGALEVRHCRPSPYSC